MRMLSQFRRNMILILPFGLILATLSLAQDTPKAKPETKAANKSETPSKTGPSASKPGETEPSQVTEADPDAKVVKTNEEWAKLLTPEQFQVTRMKGTEAPFTGKYATGHYKGIFVCIACGAPLFNAKTKFNSGTGWPSFYQAVSSRAIEQAMDYSVPGMPRVEVNCRRCDAHLGHVFDDGPAPTGLRYCINSVSISLKPLTAFNKKADEKGSDTAKAGESKSETAPATSSSATPTTKAREKAKSLRARRGG